MRPDPCVLTPPAANAVRVVGVRDWRFNQHIEDIEWLLKLQSADGSASTGVSDAIGSQCLCIAAPQAGVQVYTMPALPRCCCCCCTTTTHSELAGAVQHQPQPAVE